VRFVATVKNGAGPARSVEVEAADRVSALEQFRDKGGIVLSLAEAGAAPRRSSFRLFRGAPGRLDVEFGLRQLSSMLRSGLSLLVALRTAAEQARTRRAARVWNELGDTIETGVSLHEAMQSSRCFDPYTLALVRVGEQSGELDSTLVRAAENLEQIRDMRAMLLNALIYPALVVVMTFGVCAFMVVKVIPQIQVFLQQANRALPYITQVLLDISNWLRAYALHLGLGFGAAVLALFLVRLNPQGREWTDKVALYLPVVGHILRLSRTAVVARGLSILLESGVSLLDGLGTVTHLIRNRRLIHRLEDARESVIRGDTLAHALSAAPEFLPMLAKMAAVGESTGTLGETLGEIARFHEIMLQNAVRRFGTMIEPILILVVGGIVGFVYTAFFMALFSIATAA
jgi:type II secretory pathway component PulF